VARFGAQGRVPHCRAVLRRKFRNTGPSADTRVTVENRANGLCERCGGNLYGKAASIHHRRPRRMGGTTDPAVNTASNLMVICGSGVTGCHGWIESNRTQAYAEGWLLHSGQNPEAIPARIHGLGFRLLTPEGGYKALWE
jgi:hypothetical protein